MRRKQKIINLFNDKDVYHIRYVISIEAEEDVNLFWDFISASNNPTHDLIHAFVTKFHNFALSFIRENKAIYFEITLEESDGYFYFTLWNQKMARSFKSYIQNTPFEFLYDKKKISIKLSKLKCLKNIEKINLKNEKREQYLINSVTNPEENKWIEAYTFLSHEDLEYLLKLNEDMQELAFKINQVGFNKNIFISLRSIFSLFCLTLSYYERISPITITITNFSNLINGNGDRFIELNTLELMLIDGFLENIDTWLQTLFINGGANLYFMDKSLKADYEMIQAMITPQEDTDDEISLDDIFDF